jgi:hypothetical protein
MLIENIEIANSKVDISCIGIMAFPCHSCSNEMAQFFTRIENEHCSLDSVLGRECLERFVRGFACVDSFISEHENIAKVF